MKDIDKILIANRGEIAVRVMRTCREMGIRTVAIFSEADRAAMHTRYADEAYAVGPAPAKASYLCQEKIIEIAHRSGAQAIHPGYGFLSENPEFADKVVAAGLIFIGPPAAAMRAMGDKTAARQAMQAAGVPIVPGTPQPLANADAAVARAEAIGYPVLLKAAAGGGGKGMRIVDSATEMATKFRAAASEALSAFGDGRVYLEKYLTEPRHIEFQILADEHGNVLHIGERECSIQRRHQKVIEEAPSVVLDDTLRQKMGEAAVMAAQACGYTNAGTIEFLVDKNRDFYFLEMNTRLQVEHPVTEMVYGLDLVRLQIDIARGLPLPMRQTDIRPDGHAIECRVYAEDPANHFLPSIGKITHLQKPDGPGVRDDSGVAVGDEISVYYDPMIAKLVVKAPSRELAIRRMVRALHEYRIMGVKTTIPFCAWVLQHPRFIDGNFDTHFVQNEYFKDGATTTGALSQEEALAAALGVIFEIQKLRNGTTNSKTISAGAGHSSWRHRGWKHDRG